ncbi:MAG TPA: metalloregulator ArsR/SmtB family transcription factor [Myxococcales bacterium]|jgi:ArsR family transcriptional regulator
MPEESSVQVQARSQTELLRVLAHPIRLQVLWLLCDGEMHVNSLAERLGKGQAIVSQQLRILRMAGLVESWRLNGFAYYRIADANRRDLLRGIHDFSEKLSLVMHAR